MSTKKEGNQYDKIFKENLESVTLALIEKVLHIQVASYEKMPQEVQRTLERKPDQLLKITDKQGDTFLLQLEFQLADEDKMVDRMLEYRAILNRKYDFDIRQYVLFLSDHVPQMSTRIEKENLNFSFYLIQLSQINYELFLSSDKGDEIVFAVLGNFGSTTPEEAAGLIVQRLNQTSPNQMERDRHLQQLRVLANLRKLTPFVEIMIESISQYIKEEDDFLFKKGQQKGKEEGMLEGKAKGILEGKSEGKLEGKLEGKVEAIVKFLKDGILTTQQLVSYFDVTEEFVEDLRKSLNK
ncbi:hypothetical protein QNI19_06015 [Cytophagaceae bacterium DM2B3-1]|uniref:Rpn family recombination-promoting nuclease/putative transposase n=1 Tax=Xanthocytophaga flava TaxID=3048013 RepID=A0ABT7CFR2_9BACT|nr:hypothetical protein [Xanthocytophaga flavus]MDJ1492477.1 hypothetical protein [Xanthocytophaga flavus]